MNEVIENPRFGTQSANDNFFLGGAEFSHKIRDDRTTLFLFGATRSVTTDKYDPFPKRPLSNICVMAPGVFYRFNREQVRELAIKMLELIGEEVVAVQRDKSKQGTCELANDGT